MLIYTTYEYSDMLKLLNISQEIINRKIKEREGKVRMRGGKKDKTEVISCRNNLLIR